MSSCNVLLQCSLAMSSCNVLSQCPLATSSHDGYILLSYLLIVPRNRRWISTALSHHSLGFSSCRVVELSDSDSQRSPHSRLPAFSHCPPVAASSPIGKYF